MRSQRFMALFGAFLSAFTAEAQSGQVQVELSSSEGSPLMIEATFKNNGPDDLALLKAGTILGSTRMHFLEAEKLEAGGVSTQAEFQGIFASIDYSLLKPEHYEALAAGSSISRTIDAAALYGLDIGTYAFSAAGTISAQPDASHQPTVAVAYQSNTLTVVVDEAAAAQSQVESLQRRAIIQDDFCTNSTQLDMVLSSLDNCKSLAEAAAVEASDPTSMRFAEYFRSNDTEARKVVADRLAGVARECSTRDSGKVKIFCNEPYGWDECSAPLVAYTFATSNWIMPCPLFYDTRPALPQKCHSQDHATTMIHEMTHNYGVYEPATQDVAYSYPEIIELEPDMALENADTYSLFANAVYLDCPVESYPGQA